MDNLIFIHTDKTDNTIISDELCKDIEDIMYAVETGQMPADEAAAWLIQRLAKTRNVTCE